MRVDSKKSIANGEEEGGYSVEIVEDGVEGVVRDKV